MATTEAIMSGISRSFSANAVPARVLVCYADVGSIYKRLFNHRPVLQNEVHYFVQEFEVGVTTCHVSIKTAFICRQSEGTVTSRLSRKP